MAAVSASSPGGGWYGSSSAASAMQINQGTSPGQDRQSQERQTGPTAQRPTTNQHRATQISIEMPEIDQALVLFGVKGPRRTLELAQIDTLRHGQDGLLFWTLGKEYKKLRGALRYWFSIWRLSHCDFVKFARIRANRVIFRGRELPTDTIYDYNPRPPNAEYPPISPHEFELAFASCSSGCVFSLFHDCIEPPSGTFALERIPKRKRAIDLNEATLEHAWGIQAQYVISFVHMLFYHCLIFAATFGFWGWWLVKHSDDLQNAAVPLTTVAVLLSLFWGSAGILKVLREPS
ncbi:hypothetical protein MMC28_010343 [Mycoblastus sanguinarius]|nr:hypothetical protein [Mycoblastus sanguinarius]